MQPARTGDVALLLPLTGRASTVGNALSNAAQLAVFDLGVDAFNYRIYDTQGTIEGAQAAVEMAVIDGVGLIVGPLFGQSAAAVAPIASAAGLNVVSFSNDRTVAGGPVFVFGLLPSAQVDRVVGFAGDRGYGRFAIMGPGTPFGEGVASATWSAVNRIGAALVDTRRYPPGDGDLTPMVKDLADFDRRAQDLKEQRTLLAGRTDEASKRALARLKGRDTLGDPSFDALMLPSTAKGRSNWRRCSPTTTSIRARVRFLGTATWDEPGLGREPTMVGSWYAAPRPRRVSRSRRGTRRRLGNGRPASPPSPTTRPRLPFHCRCPRADRPMTGTPSWTPAALPGSTASSGSSRTAQTSAASPSGKSPRTAPALSTSAPTTFADLVN